MKPRNKYQANILSLSKSLPKLGNDMHSWAFEKSIPHIGLRTKKGVVSCLSCGEVYNHNVEDKKHECPGCNRTIRLVTTRKRTEDYRRWVAFISIVDGYQVVRYIELKATCKAGQKPNIHSHEILQQWFEPFGKTTIIGKNRYTMGCADSFIGEMEIRIDDYRGKYNLYPDVVHPKMELLPIYKRNGLKNSLHGTPPHEVFVSLLDDNKAETLLKTKQYDLFKTRLCSNRSSSINRFWSTIIIAIRNNYKVKDATMYLDYLDLLAYFRRDLKSQKYILPVNLKKEHDRLFKKKRDIEDRQLREREQRRREEDIKKREADIKFFYENKSKFFGLLFSSGSLDIKFLETIEEFKKEADIHKHCVYSNAYYAKSDSLIFSARINGEPIETVEFSLEKMKVVQSRGLHNRATEYHKDIVRLVEKHASEIHSRAMSLQATA